MVCFTDWRNALPADDLSFSTARITIANDFVAGDTHRLTVFGTFTSKDT